MIVITWGLAWAWLDIHGGFETFGDLVHVAISITAFYWTIHLIF